MPLNELEHQVELPKLVTSREWNEQTEARPGDLAGMLEISHKLIVMEEAPLLNWILSHLEATVGYTFAAITGAEAGELTLLAYHGPELANKIGSHHFSITNPQADYKNHWSPLFLVEPPAPFYNALVEVIEAIIHKTSAKRLEGRLGWLVLPLIFREQTIGFLCLGQNLDKPYDPDALAKIETLTNYAALAIGTERLHRQARNLAIVEERSRLGQELHDNLAQILVFLKLKVIDTNTLLATGQLGEAQTNLQELKQLISETYTDVREEIFNLQAKITSGLSFSEMLRKYVAKYKKFYGLDIELVVEDESLLEFPIEVGIQVIRIIQEGLINVRKHAGVDQARLSFTRTGEQLQISIEDEGQGFNVKQLQQTGQAGFGLDIMRERAESIGGTLAIESRPDRGVRLIIELPTSAQPVNDTHEYLDMPE